VSEESRVSLVGGAWCRRKSDVMIASTDGLTRALHAAPSQDIKWRRRRRRRMHWAALRCAAVIDDILGPLDVLYARRDSDYILFHVHRPPADPEEMETIHPQDELASRVSASTEIAAITCVLRPKWISDDRRRPGTSLGNLRRSRDPLIDAFPLSSTLSWLCAAVNRQSSTAMAVGFSFISADLLVTIYHVTTRLYHQKYDGFF